MSLVTQVGFDAIQPNIGNIPKYPFAVGGYVNGAVIKYIWKPSDWLKFPNAYHIRINVTGELSRGNCLDVETLDATPNDVKPWIVSVKDSLDPLLVYCNRSNLSACVAARNDAQKACGRYAFIWCATLDGTVTDRAMTQVEQLNNDTVDMSLIMDWRLIRNMQARIGHQ